MKRKRYSEDEDRLIRAFYADVSTQRIADMLGRSYYGVVQRAYNLGLKKSERYEAERMAKAASRVRELGKKHRFGPGQPPWNKGKRLPAHVREKIVMTSFRKGHLPANTLYDGCIRERKDTDGDRQKWIRTAPGEWKMLARHVWEQHHGLIPPGYVIVHRDGDALNCEIGNLQLISRAEHAAINRMGGYSLPPELRDTILTQNKLTAKIREYEEQNQ